MINLILSNTNRSLTYLKEIIKNDIKINKIILYTTKKKELFNYIMRNKLRDKLIFCKTNNINANYICDKLEVKSKNLNIISTYPGEIVNNMLLLRKKLLHCHPGNLPNFKGSTTIYYSILKKKKICVTIFLMSSSIDCGQIVYKKFFDNPKNFTDLEKNFDDEIRAFTLVEFLKSKKKYEIKYARDVWHPYYIAHPIIRHLVLKKDD